MKWLDGKIDSLKTLSRLHLNYVNFFSKWFSQISLGASSLESNLISKGRDLENALFGAKVGGSLH